MKHILLVVSIFLFGQALAQNTWTATNGPFGGNVADIERDASGNTYAIVSQTLFKSTNNGSSWQKLVTVSPTSLYINDLLFSNNKFYAIYYSSFYTSSDGLTWTRPATTFPFSNAQKVMKFGPDGFLAVYGSDGIFISKDEGVTWVNAISDKVYYNGYERVVATTNGDLYAISRNANLNNFQGFELKKLPYPGLNGTFDPANWQIKYSTTKSGTITTSTASATVTGVGTSFTTQVSVGSQLYNSTGTQYIGSVLSITNNTTLTLSGNASVTTTASSYSADPYQFSTHLMSFGSNVYLVTANNILITQDGGTTWPSIKGNITASGFWGFGGVNSNGAVYYYNGSNNEIYSLINPTPASSNWTITPATTFSNLSTSVLGFSFISTSSFLVATNSAGVFKSTDTGATYTLATTGITGATIDEIAIANTTGKIFAARYGSGYISSIDGGATWTTTPLSNTISKVMKLANGTILFYGGGYIVRSTDNGVNFTSDNVYRGNDRDIVEAANGDLYLFYGVYVNPNNNPKIAKSIDGGANWVDLAITGLPSNFLFYYAAIDGTTNILLHGYDYTAQIYKTYKVVGTTATQLTMPNTNSFNNLFFHNNKFYASQFSSYYYTSDLGTTWTPVGFSGNKVFPIKNPSYTGIAVSRAGALYISQDEGGTWSNTTLPEASAYITSIATDASGDYYASAAGTAVLKFTNELLVDPATLPPYINFNWQPLKGPYGGRQITKIQSTPDGNTLFSVVTNRLWKYTTASSLWSLVDPVSATGSVFDVEVDGTGVVYALTNTNPQKIYKSVDLGVIWTPLTSGGLPTGTTSIRRIEVLSNGSILAFGTNGSFGSIYKSSDAGVSFTARFTSTYNQVYGSDGGSASRKPAVSPVGGGGTIALLGLPAEGMVVSTDFGTTWTVKSISSVVNPTNGFVGSYMYDKDGNLLMHYIFDSTVTPWATDVAKSTDNGTTWTNLNTPNVPTPAGSFYSKRVIALGTGEYLMCIQSQFDCYRSTNGGATWTNIGNVGDVFLWADTRGTTSYILGSGDAGILKTVDGGLTFTPFSNGIPHPTAAEITLLNNKDLVIGATRPYYSSDFGQNFTLATLQPASKYLLVGDSIIGYGGNRRMLKSKDAGKTWTEFGADQLYFTFLTKDATGTGFYGSDGRSLKYSTNLTTWTDIVLSGLPSSYSITSLVTDQGGFIYAVTVTFDPDTGETLSRDVYKIVFGSAVNISSSIGTTSPANILYFDGKAYLYDSKGIIFKSTDGEIWTQSSAPAGTSLVVANNYLFIPASGSVLWLSRNDGATWQSVGDVPPSSGAIPVFRNIVINEYDGYAYATLTNSVAKKSASVVIPDDKTKPLATTYLPVNNAINTSITGALTITFDEITRSVTGKKIRIFDLANQAIPVETIDMSTAVQNYKTWSVTPTIPLSYNKTYFIVIDAGAVTDIFGNTYNGISATTTWRFTTIEEPDTQAPAIVIATTDLKQTKGVAKRIDITVTDNKNLPVDKTKVYYRGIAKLDAEPFTSATLSVVSGGGTISTTFTIEAQDNWYDEMGLEFYFEAEDASGNKKRAPAAANTYLYSYVTYPTASSPILPSSRISLGGKANNYRMISVPFELQDKQVLTILDELGAADIKKWRLFTYAGGDQFTENPTDFIRGKGYWINVKNSPGEIKIDGATTPANNRTDFFKMDLAAGWNQIGNPYPVEINWDEIKTGNASIGKLKVFNGSSYTDESTLLPYQGAFVFVSGSSPVNDLVVRFKGITTGGRLASKNEGTDLSKPNWIVPISAVSNEITNSMGGVGMNEEANLDWDQFDDINPPRFIDYAELAFNKKYNAYHLAKDVVPAQDEYVWEFSVNASEGQTQLKWDNTTITGDKDLILFDLDRQKLINMIELPSYSFNAKEGNSFRIYFGKDLHDRIKPTAVTLGNPFPNPTNDNSTIGFSLPESKSSYKVQLEVYNSVGQRTAVLVNGDLPAGFYTSTWDIESNKTGLYFYRLSVSSKEVRKVLTEKIIINR